MRRFRYALAAILLGAIQIAATVPLGPGAIFPLGPSSLNGGVTFVGAGDVVPGALLYYGLRAYNFATAGARVANVCNASATCADVATTPTGLFNVASAKGSPLFCGAAGGQCNVKTLYNQIIATTCSGGSCDLTQATAGQRPTLVFNCIGTLPCMIGLNTNSTQITAPGSLSQAPPYTALVFGQRTGNFGSFSSGFGVGTQSNIAWSSANNLTFYAGGGNTGCGAPDNQWHFATGDYNTSSLPSGYLGGQPCTATNVATVTLTQSPSMFTDGFGDLLAGDLTEAGLWPLAWTKGQVSSAGLNALGFYQLGTASVPNVILDSDGGNDEDNAADMRAFVALAAARKIFPIGYIASDADPFNVSSMTAFMNFQPGGVTFPRYAYQGSTGSNVSTWSQPVTNQFNPGDTRTNYTECEAGYRQLLAHAQGPVIIILGGGATCIDQLLQSPANYNSDGLGTGLSLILAHVSQVIWAAGSGWPTGGTNDFNLDQNTTATADFFTNWPAAVPVRLYGVDLSTGTTGPFSVSTATACSTSSSDPYALAFFSSIGASAPCSRIFFSQPAFLFAMFGLGNKAFSYGGQNGSVSFNTGTTAYSWSATSGAFSYMANSIDQFGLANLLCTYEQIAGTTWCS